MSSNLNFYQNKLSFSYFPQQKTKVSKTHVSEFYSFLKFVLIPENPASDMAFNPDQSRNISLDIRYALFIIDKFAGAGYLLNEMTIVE
jgi:hypothetical protein